jgi:hypothetical protein
MLIRETKRHFYRNLYGFLSNQSDLIFGKNVKAVYKN